LLENVAALLGRGLGDVLGTLASLGYDAEWHCIPASYLGAPHRRDRIWIIAYPAGNRWGEGDAHVGWGAKGTAPRQELGLGYGCEALAHAASVGLPRPWQPIIGRGAETQGQGQAARPLASSLGDIWRVEPNVGRVANGVPDRAHRLKALGNAVVPQIPELIGRAILATLASET
jgi:DNA (cytosine-5)-methyltransferase 1